MPRKENGVPGLGGGIWSQKRGSFKMEKAAQRNAAREARLAVNAPVGLRPGATPSPAASEGSGALPFAIPLQPTPKAGRSLSHSQGQRDFSQGGAQNLGTNGDREGGALPLGLLTEEDADTETESELGGVLTQTASHPYALQRTSTLPAAAFGGYLGGQGYDDEDDDIDSAGGPHSHGGAGNGYGGMCACSSRSLFPAWRRLFADAHTLSAADLSRRSQWQSHLGWEDLPNINESRRHSLAELPTRRGSMVGSGSHGAASHSREGMLSSRFPPPSSSSLYDWESMQYREGKSAHPVASMRMAPNPVTVELESLRRSFPLHFSSPLTLHKTFASCSSTPSPIYHLVAASEIEQEGNQYPHRLPSRPQQLVRRRWRAACRGRRVHARGRTGFLAAPSP